MKIVLVLPHRDVTLEPSFPQRWNTVDSSRAFAERILRGDGAAAESAPIDAPPAEAARALLLEKTASSLMARGARHALHRGLRVYGARLTAVSAGAASVRLTLDDLELTSGTTERSADVLAASRGPLPFEPELASAVRACDGAEEVCVYLERDQQLPAAVWVAARLGADQPLSLAGSFAHRHAATLLRLPPFRRARVVDVEPVEQRLCLPPTFEGELPELRWLVEPGPPPSRPWAGLVDAQALLRPTGLVDSGCRAAVLPFCRVRDGAVLTADGELLDADVMARAVDVLHRAGVPLLGEWSIGAPGVGEDDLQKTADALSRGPFRRVLGARPFHWTGQVRGRSFGGTGVRIGEVEPERDLARSVPFAAEGTIPGDRLSAALERCARALLLQGQGSPGRIAAAYLIPERTVPSGPHLGLHPDCAVVELKVSLTGAPGPVWYAANLRSGVILSLDSRIAPMLAQLAAPAPAAQALAGVPDAQRGKLVHALIQKGVLAEVAV